MWPGTNAGVFVDNQQRCSDSVLSVIHWRGLYIYLHSLTGILHDTFAPVFAAFFYCEIRARISYKTPHCKWIISIILSIRCRGNRKRHRIPKYPVPCHKELEDSYCTLNWNLDLSINQQKRRISNASPSNSLYLSYGLCICCYHLHGRELYKRRTSPQVKTRRPIKRRDALFCRYTTISFMFGLFCLNSLSPP